MGLVYTVTKPFNLVGLRALMVRNSFLSRSETPFLAVGAISIFALWGVIIFLHSTPNRDGRVTQTKPSLSLA